MVDATWQETGVSGAGRRGAGEGPEQAQDRRYRFPSDYEDRGRCSCWSFLGGVIVSLFLGAMPAFHEFGFGFLTAQSWNPVTEKFGALAPIYGTIITSLIAMLIAVPFGLMIAMFLTELCPMWLRRPIGIAIELLAGIPSIIYGIWGLFVFAPFLQQHVQPPIIAAFENVPGALYII